MLDKRNHFLRRSDSMRPLVVLLPIFFLLTAVNMFGVSVAGDTITVNQSIVDGQTLISSGGAFELGFFSPAGSKNRYVGIWYHATPPDQTAVWVANREFPLAATTGDLLLTADGNLALRDNTGQVLWSTVTSNMTNPVVQLLDSGNLVLRNDDTTKVVAWQSFDYPTDTLIPGMKLGRALKTHRDWRLRSWRTTSDPSPGIYSTGLDLRGAPELYIWNGSAPEARTGPWDGTSWGGSGSLRANNIFTTQLISTQDEVYYIDEMVNASTFTRFVLGELGTTRRLVWQGGKWIVYWTGPTDQCDVYAQCGANGVCNSGLSPICSCLTGFVPKSPVAWSLQDVSGGCRRRTALDCPAGDGFLKVSGVKLPDTSNATIGGNIGIDACRESCLKNCSCLAFAFLGEASGCISWHSDLIDVRDLSAGTGEDFYLRLAASELDTRTDTRSKRHIQVIVIVTSSLVALILIALIYFLWMRRYGKRGAREVSTEQFFLTLDNTLTIDDGKNEDNSLKFSVFNFSTIVAVTNDFSNTNKLGEGGFGPVYRGQLPEGQEIAVKRLSEHSGQGVEEFKNEITLIAKLQHRNLVRLLGCCIHGDEKILIYEYMTNKSLDLYLFDSARGRQLDWSKRFHIIEGIAQGILYLHKHSRLRIIHRDLKASNILLDVDMNPKISDFGLARIFGSNETQAKTRRIVGTYGYMAPEYAAGGLFSIKSDVFSFGVILLEIISGKRNTGFYQHEDSFNLLGYAWLLWKESKWLELVDPLLVDNGNMGEISRCMHVALMCVQESYVDRPTMSEAITMLHSETAPLSNPMQPAFFKVSIAAEVKSSSTISEICSLNELTITVVDSR